MPVKAMRFVKKKPVCENLRIGAAAAALDSIYDAETNLREAARLLRAVDTLPVVARDLEIYAGGLEGLVGKLQVAARTQ